MFVRNNLIRVGIVTFFGLFLTGCGLFGRNTTLVGQGVAFPQPGDGPATSESALAQPVALSSTEPDLTAEPTPTPTNTPPTVTAVPQPVQPHPTAAPPRIHSFTADVINTVSGKKITFTWQSSGATSARIYNWANGSIRFPAFWDVAPTGTLTVDLSGTRRSDPHFELFVYQGDANSPSDTRSLQIPWDCSLDYFFEPGSDICPWSKPTYTTAVSQEFQGGRMLWLEELDWIYVLYDEVYANGGPGGDLQWERYDDNWTERAVADMPLIPPPGLLAPVGRFGLVWKENPTVRERLGWALAPETAYDGAWQLQPSDTDNPGDGAIFILLEDGQAARLSGFDIWGWLWTVFVPIS